MYRTKIGARAGAIIAAAALGFLAVSGAAQATVTNGTATISCDASAYQSVKSVSHTSTSAMTFWANDVNPASTTRVTAESSNGNWLSSQLVNEGSYVAWSSVAASTYQFYAKRSTSGDCNGWPLGNGNYTLAYSIVY